jgi:F-type H+-transporting ATPase subunit gamma
VVVVTSNRGLCGAFQHQYLQRSRCADSTEKYVKQRRDGKVTMLFIGKKGFDYFRRRYRDITFISPTIFGVR